MKDIDFDELDRAVNSLMSEGGPNQSSDQKDDRPALEIVPSSDDEPVAAAPVKTPAPKPEVPSRSEEPAERPVAVANPRRESAGIVKKSGRFMDMVHQSSDMRTSRPLSPPSARASRYRSGLDTSSSVGADISPPVEPQAKIDNVLTDERAIEAAKSTAVPNPIDFSGSSPENVGPEISSLTPTEEAGFSPFIPDAKVDKRPLGGSMTPLGVSTDTTGEVLTSQDLDARADNQLSVDIDAQMPAELESDLMAIEAEPKPEPVVEASPQVEDVVEVKAPTMKSVETKPEVAKLDAPTQPRIDSIPKQYSTEPQKTDQDVEGDIFNTDSFAQPLAHPAKQKSGWLTVVLIVLLIILGIGIGAVLYLFVL